jgi:hypothetical protein
LGKFGEKASTAKPAPDSDPGEPGVGGPYGRSDDAQSHCAGANQDTVRREWSLPSQGTHRRAAPAQGLPQRAAKLPLLYRVERPNLTRRSLTCAAHSAHRAPAGVPVQFTGCECSKPDCAESIRSLSWSGARSEAVRGPAPRTARIESRQGSRCKSLVVGYRVRPRCDKGATVPVRLAKRSRSRTCAAHGAHRVPAGISMQIN